ncbi:ShlB/FhaC/HecB family hemolysin secretion/activation protein [Piscinibacterium candidicorallinum]|uniref:ShlB/FhaC/HecB family hemolysin secretion/activation protein n=1 Tax=Piscinibacterium candidicorallinum TaxID=1793872 RepID=A0ABV7H3F0_9BURK
MTIAITLRPRALAVALALAGLLGAGTHQAAHAQAAAPASITISEFKIEGSNPLGEARTQRLLQPFTGEVSGDAQVLERLQGAAKALEAALQEAGWGLHRVVLPVQTLQSTVRLQVVRFSVGQVMVQGNKHFAESNIRASLPALQPGQTPNLQNLAREISVANENPAKRVVVGFREGKAPDTVDANLRAEDVRPWSAVLAASNAGTEDSTRPRVTVALAHYNLLGGDESLVLSGSVAPERTDVRQFGLQARKPFYGLGGTAALYYTDSSASSGALGPGLDITGKGQSAGLSWTQSLPPLGEVKHNLTLALEDKLFEGTQLRGAGQLSPDVRSRPISLGYALKQNFSAGEIGATIDLAANLSGGASNTAAAYAANRLGAPRGWKAVRASVEGRHAVGAGFDLAGQLRLQYSADPLIAGEQFGFGGASLVRGLEERALTGDRGVAGSLELSRSVFVSGFKLLAFVDAAQVDRLNVQPGLSARESIATAGVGMRWTWGNWLATQIDYGWVIDGSQVPLIERNSGRLHAALQVRF